MSVLTTLKDANRGWSEILAGRGEWHERFAFTPEGLTRAFSIYGGAVAIALLLWMLRYGSVLPQHLMALLIVFLSPLAFLVVLGTLIARFASPQINMTRIVIPGLYILALMAVIEGVTMALGASLLGAITAVTGFFLFKLARANGLAVWPSVAFGLVFFVLLVLVRLAV